MSRLSDQRCPGAAQSCAGAQAERHRVARDLHDGAQQRLVALRLDAASLRLRLRETPDETVLALLDAIDTAAERTLRDLRRIVAGLASPTLVEEGLGSAIRDLALDMRIGVEVDDRLTRRLPADIESAALMMTTEALTNVIRHAGATLVRVGLCTRGSRALIAVMDNGRGGADPQNGSGLLGLQQRAAALGGRVTVSSIDGEGTLVAVDLPAS